MRSHPAAYRHGLDLVQRRAGRLLERAIAEPDRVHFDAEERADEPLLGPRELVSGRGARPLERRHRGLGNSSGDERPLLYITYARPFWLDVYNFDSKRYPELPECKKMSREERMGKRQRT